MLAVAVLVPWGAGREGLAITREPAVTLLGAGLTTLAIVIPQSAAEEIMLRGFPLVELSRGIGRVAAVLVTGSLFGILHLKNPGASALAALNIALIGIAFGILRFRSGSLWLPIGLHVSWNFSEAFLWGQPVSGLPPGMSLVHQTFAGSEAWTGGAFGPEASAITAIITILLALLALLPRTKSK
jgi:membrane protease YdiL (CAAX protease family)